MAASAYGWIRERLARIPRVRGRAACDTRPGTLSI